MLARSYCGMHIESSVCAVRGGFAKSVMPAEVHLADLLQGLCYPSLATGPCGSRAYMALHAFSQRHEVGAQTFPG